MLDEGTTLLVFTISGKAVQCIEYQRDTVDFADLEEYRSGIPIDNALFVLDERGRVVLAEGK